MLTFPLFLVAFSTNASCSPSLGIRRRSFSQLRWRVIEHPSCAKINCPQPFRSRLLHAELLPTLVARVELKRVHGNVKTVLEGHPEEWQFERLIR